ncbi:MAG: nucleotide exchange factor GrpE [Luteibaculaceae bacterium]
MSTKDKSAEEINEAQQSEEQKAEQTTAEGESNFEQFAENEQEAPEPEENNQDKKIQELNDKYLRLYSDFENFRKRTAKEKLDLLTNGGENVIKDLLSVLDDFERAAAANEKNDDAASIKEGYALIHNKLVKVLAQKGLKMMESNGAAFNSDIHEAVTKFPAQNEEQKDKVIDTLEKGYYLNDKVIRYAKVVVGE